VYLNLVPLITYPLIRKNKRLYYMRQFVVRKINGYIIWGNSLFIQCESCRGAEEERSGTEEAVRCSFSFLFVSWLFLCCVQHGHAIFVMDFAFTGIYFDVWLISVHSFYFHFVVGVWAVLHSCTWKGFINFHFFPADVL